MYGGRALPVMSSAINKYRLIVTLDPRVWEALMHHVLDLNLRSETGTVARTKAINRILAQHFGISDGSVPLKAPQKAVAPRTKLRTAKSA